MPLTRNDLRRIAQDVAAAHSRNLQVIGVTSSDGATGYAEIILVDTACTAEPCRLLIGADRAQSEPTLRAAIHDELRKQIGARALRGE